MGLIQNRSALFAAVDKDVQKGIQKFGALIDVVTNAVHFSLMAKTPVHSGETVRNYIWTVNQPFNGPSISPIAGGPTGQTNKMPLGSEPRRSANEAAATTTLEALNFKNPFKKYFVTNNSPQVRGLELGLLPMGDGFTSRSPSGMFLITEVAVNSQIRSGVLK